MTFHCSFGRIIHNIGCDTNTVKDSCGVGRGEPCFSCPTIEHHISRLENRRLVGPALFWSARKHELCPWTKRHYRE